MPDTQYEILMKAMAEQNKMLEQLKKDSEERASAQYKMGVFMKDELAKTSHNIGSLRNEVQPVIDLSSSVKGFDRISVWIFKFVLGLAALIGAITAIALFLKKMLTGTWGI